MKPALLNLDAALRVDPFSGDMDGDSRILQDKIVTARKACECHQCAETITPGQRIRSRAEVFDGAFERYKWCQVCTELMTRYDDEDFEDEWEKRCRTNRENH